MRQYGFVGVNPPFRSGFHPLIRRRPHYAESVKRRFNSENASNVFRSHHGERIKKKTQQSPVSLDLFLRKTRSGISRDHRDVIVFEKLRFQNVSRPHENAKPAYPNSSGLKSFFEKLYFRDGLVWAEGRTVERKLRFQSTLARYELGHAWFHWFTNLSFFIFQRLRAWANLGLAWTILTRLPNDHGTASLSDQSKFTTRQREVVF